MYCIKIQKYIISSIIVNIVNTIVRVFSGEDVRPHGAGRRIPHIPSQAKTTGEVYGAAPPWGAGGSVYSCISEAVLSHPPTQGVSLGAPEGPQAVGQRNESAVSLVRFPWQPIICDLLMYPIGTAAGSGKGGLTVEISGSQNS